MNALISSMCSYCFSNLKCSITLFVSCMLKQRIATANKPLPWDSTAVSCTNTVDHNSTAINKLLTTCYIHTYTHTHWQANSCSTNTAEIIQPIFSRSTNCRLISWNTLIARTSKVYVYVVLISSTQLSSFSCICLHNDVMHHDKNSS